MYTFTSLETYDTMIALFTICYVSVLGYLPK